MQDVDNFKDNVRKRVAKLDENLVPTTDMFSLRFSRASIETSLKNLANGKAVGDDGIPNEFLKNGGEAMLNSLVDLFTVVSDLKIIPSEWKNGIIKHLHKSGSAMDLDNYRGITLTSNVYKVFSKIFATLLQSIFLTEPFSREITKNDFVQDTIIDRPQKAPSFPLYPILPQQIKQTISPDYQRP
jgi:hypothetical protein